LLTYYIIKNIGGKEFMKGIFRKIIGVCLIGLGLGILLVLLLPITGWLILIGILAIAIGFLWFAC
jgi:hypothetical protein